MHCECGRSSAPVVDTQVAGRIGEVGPVEVDLPRRSECGELRTRVRLCVAQHALGVARLVHDAVAPLVVKVARKVPSELVAAEGDTRARRGIDHVKAVLVDGLEEERAVHRGSVEEVVEGVRPACDPGRGGVLELVEVVGGAVVDHGACPDLAVLEAQRLGAADGRGEPEREEPDGRHAQPNHREQPDLLPPGRLSLLGA